MGGGLRSVRIREYHTKCCGRTGGWVPNPQVDISKVKNAFICRVI